MSSALLAPTVAPEQQIAAPTRGEGQEGRRLREDDAGYQRLHAEAVRRLSRSLDVYVRALRQGNPHAAVEFIQRHTAILRALYVRAHGEGQRDYWPLVSLRPNRYPTAMPSPKVVQQRLAFYAVGSVAKLAHEGEQAARATRHALSEDADGAAWTFAGTSDPLGYWRQALPTRVALEGEIVWAGLQDGYLTGGQIDEANPYQWVWWLLDPMAKVHCGECPRYAMGSPYGAPGSGENELWTTPGDGNTECGAGCKCSLSYGGGPETLPDFYEVVDLLPKGMPLTAAQREALTTLAPAKGISGTAGDPGLNDGQKAALDQYRAAVAAWDAVRGTLPSLAGMFDQESPLATQAWDALTQEQQRVLQMVVQAYVAWESAAGATAGAEGEQQFAELVAGLIVLYSPDQARDKGKFAYQGGSTRSGTTASGQKWTVHEYHDAAKAPSSRGTSAYAGVGRTDGAHWTPQWKYNSVAERWQDVHPRFGEGMTTQCARCARIYGGPHSGEHPDHEIGNASHGNCSDCESSARRASLHGLFARQHPAASEDEINRMTDEHIAKYPDGVVPSVE